MKFSAATLALGLAATAKAASIAKRWPQLSDTTILQYALTLEHLENAFYAGGLAQFSAQDFADAGFAPNVYQRIQEVGAHEAIHVKTLSGALGKKAVKPCKYSFPYDDVVSFLGVAKVLENIGVSAYLGAAPDIDSAAYLSVAASILTVEARHTSEISTFLKTDGAPGPFDTALDYNGVYSLATPLIVSCPKSNAALPFTAFPALALGAPALGEPVQFTFDLPKKDKKKQLYAIFYNGLSEYSVKINKQGKAVVPKALSGRVYAYVSSSKTLNTQSTVAGPAYFDVEEADLD